MWCIKKDKSKWKFWGYLNHLHVSFLLHELFFRFSLPAFREEIIPFVAKMSNDYPKLLQNNRQMVQREQKQKYKNIFQISCTLVHACQRCPNLFYHMSCILNFSHFLKTPERTWHMQQNNVLSHLAPRQQGNKHKLTANQIAHLLFCLTVVGLQDKRWRNNFCEGHTLEMAKLGHELRLLVVGGGGWQKKRKKKRKARQKEWTAVWQLLAVWLVEGMHAARQGRPGNVIQGGCLNMTSLGAIQSAAKPSSGALPGMVAGRLQLWAHSLSTPLHPCKGGKIGEEKRGEERRGKESKGNKEKRMEKSKPLMLYCQVK